MIETIETKWGKRNVKVFVEQDRIVVDVSGHAIFLMEKKGLVCVGSVIERGWDFKGAWNK